MYLPNLVINTITAKVASWPSSSAEKESEKEIETKRELPIPFHIQYLTNPKFRILYENGYVDEFGSLTLQVLQSTAHLIPQLQDLERARINRALSYPFTFPIFQECNVEIQWLEFLDFLQEELQNHNVEVHSIHMTQSSTNSNPSSELCFDNIWIEVDCYKGLDTCKRYLSEALAKFICNKYDHLKDVQTPLLKYISENCEKNTYDTCFVTYHDQDEIINAREKLNSFAYFYIPGSPFKLMLNQSEKHIALLDELGLPLEYFLNIESHPNEMEYRQASLQAFLYSRLGLITEQRCRSVSDCTWVKFIEFLILGNDPIEPQLETSLFPTFSKNIAREFRKWSRIHTIDECFIFLFTLELNNRPFFDKNRSQLPPYASFAPALSNPTLWTISQLLSEKQTSIVLIASLIQIAGALAVSQQDHTNAHFQLGTYCFQQPLLKCYFGQYAIPQKFDLQKAIDCLLKFNQENEQQWVEIEQDLIQLFFLLYTPSQTIQPREAEFFKAISWPENGNTIKACLTSPSHLIKYCGLLLANLSPSQNQSKLIYESYYDLLPFMQGQPAIRHQLLALGDRTIKHLIHTHAEKKEWIESFIKSKLAPQAAYRIWKKDAALQSDIHFTLSCIEKLIVREPAIAEKFLSQSTKALNELHAREQDHSSVISDLLKIYRNVSQLQILNYHQNVVIEAVAKYLAILLKNNTYTSGLVNESNLEALLTLCSKIRSSHESLSKELIEIYSQKYSESTFQQMIDNLAQLGPTSLAKQKRWLRICANLLQFNLESTSLDKIYIYCLQLRYSYSEQGVASTLQPVSQKAFTDLLEQLQSTPDLNHKQLVLNTLLIVLPTQAPLAENHKKIINHFLSFFSLKDMEIVCIKQVIQFCFKHELILPQQEWNEALKQWNDAKPEDYLEIKNCYEYGKTQGIPVILVLEKLPDHSINGDSESNVSLGHQFIQLKNLKLSNKLAALKSIALVDMLLFYDFVYHLVNDTVNSSSFNANEALELGKWLLKELPEIKYKEIQEKPLLIFTQALWKMQSSERSVQTLLSLMATRYAALLFKMPPQFWVEYLQMQSSQSTTTDNMIKSLRVCSNIPDIDMNKLQIIVINYFRTSSAPLEKQLKFFDDIYSISPSISLALLPVLRTKINPDNILFIGNWLIQYICPKDLYYCREAKLELTAFVNIIRSLKQPELPIKCLVLQLTIHKYFLFQNSNVDFWKYCADVIQEIYSQPPELFHDADETYLRIWMCLSLFPNILCHLSLNQIINHLTTTHTPLQRLKLYSCWIEGLYRSHTYGGVVKKDILHQVEKAVSETVKQVDLCELHLSPILHVYKYLLSLLYCGVIIIDESEEEFYLNQLKNIILQTKKLENKTFCAVTVFQIFAKIFANAQLTYNETTKSLFNDVSLIIKEQLSKENYELSLNSVSPLNDALTSNLSLENIDLALKTWKLYFVIVKNGTLCRKITWKSLKKICDFVILHGNTSQKLKICKYLNDFTTGAGSVYLSIYYYSTKLILEDLLEIIKANHNPQLEVYLRKAILLALKAPFKTPSESTPPLLKLAIPGIQAFYQFNMITFLDFIRLLLQIEMKENQDYITVLYALEQLNIFIKDKMANAQGEELILLKELENFITDHWEEVYLITKALKL